MGTAGSSADLPTRELGGLAVDVLASAAIVLVILAVLWPPESVYWTALTDPLGETPTLVIVAALAVGIGAWVGRTSGFDLPTFVLGSVIAVGVVMGAIEVLLESDSPAHFVWYGALTACIVGGVATWTALERYRAGV